MLNRGKRTLFAAAVVVAGSFSPVSAHATTCGGILSTHCASSSGLLGHTHGCSTSGSTRTCLVHWHGTSSCNGTTSGTCTGTLNAGADGSDSNSCSYGTAGSCGFGLSTPGRSVSFPVGTTRTSCATLVTTANGGAFGSASDTQGTNCFNYS
jgi:hypothetical protein